MQDKNPTHEELMACRADTSGEAGGERVVKNKIMYSLFIGFYFVVNLNKDTN